MPEKIKNFDAHPKWSLFAKEFVKNGGKTTKACEKAGLKSNAASVMKRENPDFVDWLEQIVKRRLSRAVSKGDLAIAEAVAKGKAIDSGKRGTLKLLYERTDKLQKSVEVHNHTIINQGEALSLETLAALAQWAVANPDKIQDLIDQPSRN